MEESSAARIRRLLDRISADWERFMKIKES